MAQIISFLTYRSFKYGRGTESREREQEQEQGSMHIRALMRYKLKGVY